MAQETQTGALYQPRGVAWGGRSEGGLQGREHMYSCRWFMLRFDRKQQNSVNQFSSAQFSHLVVSDSLQPHGLQHTKLPVRHQFLSLLKLMSTESVMPSSHLILRHPLLLPPSIFPSIRFFSNESALRISGQSIEVSAQDENANEYSGLISFRMDWLALLAVQGTLKSLLQHHSSKASILWRSAFSIVQLSHPYMTTEKP